MKVIHKKFLWIIISLFLFCLFCIESIFIKTVKADDSSGTEIMYTYVLDDLQKDENFELSKYPAKDDDFSLQVIQIAESYTGELFVYVYRPSALSNDDCVGQKISISTDYEGMENARLYTLSLLSTSGTLDKYLVDGFSVLKGDVMRTYGISSIYRLPTSNDIVVDGDNVIDYISVKVGQRWTATTVNGNVQYAVSLLDVITVENKHVGFIRYLDNFWFFNACTDSHYVAFNTDKPIDTLLEVDVHYYYVNKTKIENSNFIYSSYNKEIIGKQEEVYDTLYADEIFSKPAQTIGADSYKYKRIQSIDTFLDTEKDEKLTEGTKAALKECQWVLRFFETPYSSSLYTTTSADSVIQNIQTTTVWSEVTEVVLLRMEYEYQDDFYEVGVVDNISSGDTIPDNENPLLPDLDSWLEDFMLKIKSIIFSLICAFFIGLLLFFGLPLLPHIVNFVIWIFKGIFKILWFIICLPFNLIGLIFKPKNKK